MKLVAAAIAVFCLSCAAVVWTVRATAVGRAVDSTPARQGITTSQPSLDDIARRSAYDTDLNRTRLGVIQAAYAYTVMPCEARNKTRLVEAITGYAKAFLARTDCSLLSCSRDRIVTAAAAFDTSEDRKVQGAIKAAFARGGISAADFPIGRQMTMLGLIAPDSAGNICAGGAQVRASR